MRINREILMKLARDTVTQRVRGNRGLMAAYLCGSLLEDEFLLGGTTDIDLVLIHSDAAPIEREIIHLTDDVHVDISHQIHRDYRHPRTLRQHPWQGPTLNNCLILHDPQHLLDFTQASVRGGFFHSEYVLDRSRKGAEHARQIWMGFHTHRPETTPGEISRYLRAVEHATNAVAGLSGPPLTERRFLLKFPVRAMAAGKPALQAALLGLLGAPQVDPETVRTFLPDWRKAYTSLKGETVPARLHPLRLPYYSRAIDDLLNSAQPMAALWPLLRTWTQVAEANPDDTEVQQEWMATFERLGLIGESFASKIDALDAYLDAIEEAQEEWARANGAVTD